MMPINGQWKKKKVHLCNGEVVWTVVVLMLLVVAVGE